MPRGWLFWLSLVLVLCLTAPARAQSATSALLLSPDLRGFPQVEVYLDVHTAQGGFVYNLQLDQIQLLENNQPVELQKLELLYPGAQVVWAINPGPPFGIRNKDGVSRYDFLKQALSRWAQERQGSSLDDLSLLITGGPSLSHTSSPQEWRQALESDQTNARQARPSLDTLARAITLATDLAPRPGMERVIFYLTPPPDIQEMETLEGLFAQAQQARIRIFTWIVTSQEALTAAPTQRLQLLSQLSGGQYFIYTGEEAIPDPESYLEALRPIYRLGYTSRVTSSGVHSLVAQVQLQSERMQTPALNFEIELQPPQPAFVSPPLQISRRLLTADEHATLGAAGAKLLLPQTVPLEVIFDFPDGRKRPLVYSALYVDGQLADENLAPPFERFEWPLEAYTTSGVHQLRVEVRDILGLSGSSIEIPVAIQIEQPETSSWEFYRQNIIWLSLLAIALAGLLLFLVLTLNGKLLPALPATRRIVHLRQATTVPPSPTQERKGHLRRSWAEKLHPQAHPETPVAQAILKPWPDRLGQTACAPLAITGDEVILGNDPTKAQLVLADPALSPMHARLRRATDGSYWVEDLNSTAGTWLNFCPVPPEGALLRHGDVLHFGQLGYLFTLRHPLQKRLLLLTPIHPNSDFSLNPP